PRDVFTAPEYDAAPAESRINLRTGERMTVQDLLEALLLESANDAAVDLAENIAGSRQATLESGSHQRLVQNRNDLVADYPWVDGVKTGYTQNAGNVLVGAGARGPGARVVTVVLGEPTEAARDADTLKLLRWGLGRFSRVRVLDRRRALASADIK